MAAIHFDTHKFIRILTEAGVSEAHAEALMEATRGAMQEIEDAKERERLRPLRLVSRAEARKFLVERLGADGQLDFEGVAEIGPSFADEIFRVFQAEHPVRIRWINANEVVERMIRRALAI